MNSLEIVGKYSSIGRVSDCDSDGYKFKCHQVGPGLVQLRAPIGMFAEAYLCQAYVKADAKKEKRMMAKFKTHLQLIKQGQFTECGRLS